MEKLIIKNFGSIKKAEIDFNKINIFIGEQATGKSLIAKVLFFCKNFFVYWQDALFFKKSIAEFDEVLIKQFGTFFYVASCGYSGGNINEK